jgi:ABC-type lipoprotein export system ATPase subunit
LPDLDDGRRAELRRHKIGFVFQFFHLIPRLTAAENIALPMVLAGVDPRRRHERLDAALTAFGLTNRARHRPDQLSGGQRQRVAIARATIMRPAILLADEPTGNLDRRSGEEVVNTLEELNRQQGITLLVVTHDPAMAGRASRRISMVDGGNRLRHSVKPAAGAMTLLDQLRFAGRASFAYPLRTSLMLLAMAIGVGSVVLLSSLGNGARRYVLDEFSALGTNLLVVLPGRSETVGGPPPLLGITPRDLTIADASALARIPTIRAVAPLSLGMAPVTRLGREREATVIGSTSELFAIRQLELAQGRFPAGRRPRAGGRPLCPRA